jgi:hypothetical protein
MAAGVVQSVELSTTNHCRATAYSQEKMYEKNKKRNKREIKWLGTFRTKPIVDRGHSGSGL